MAEGVLFDIQHYAVHDGPGIRTLVFLKGCPLRCLWCCNPESRDPRYELRHKRVRCEACGDCVKACPRGALSFIDKELQLERHLCSTCESRDCVEACTAQALLTAGFNATSDDVARRVAADLPFYRNSGGGVTFSGGEPLLQPTFLRDALRACRGFGIHTAVETCGFADPADLAAIAPLVDLFLFDVKIIEPSRHRCATGLANDLILANLRHLALVLPEKLRVRVPIVPSYTDPTDNLSAIADLMVQLGVDHLDLQPYHGLGNDKYRELGYPCPPVFSSPSANDLREIADLFRGKGVSCDLT